jgi:N4-gp56 family major capsid protein
MAYQPTSNMHYTPSMAHYPTVYYNKVGLDRLEKKFLFRSVCKPDMLPKRQGKTVVWYRYQNFASNTTPAVEGTVGTGQALSSNIVSATVSQYTSYITVSDFAMNTFIDPIIENASDLLGYQAGLSVDVITRTVIDNESSSTDVAFQSSTNYLKVSDLRNVGAVLTSNDVERFDGGGFRCILHPFALYDLVNDPDANGYADIFKYTGTDNLLVRGENERGTPVTTVADCKLMVSTNVKTQTVPNRYRVYVFGKNGVGSVDLQGEGPSDVVDPKNQKFKINTKTFTGISEANPEGTIGGVCSYNFSFTTVILDGPTGIGGSYRFRTMDAESSIG